MLFFLSLCFVNAFSQSHEITGKILDENGRPLPGATIWWCDHHNGTISDLNGDFALKYTSCRHGFLTVSYLGYQTHEIPISDELNGLKIKMEPSEYLIDEVVITDNFNGQMRRIQSMSVDRIQSDFIQQNLSGSLMQTLSRLPGVSSSDIGSGNAKPIIRGLGYYRVAFAMNGIKQSGQFWSAHTGLSVDQHNIEQLEIIKGPSSLRYGSDAIGGVINVLPPAIPQEGVYNASVSLTAKSNTQWLGASANVSGRKNDFYFRSQITHNNYGDIKIPYTDVFYLPAPVSAIEATHKVELGQHVPNTAGNESAFAFTTGIVKPWGNSYLDFSYHTSKNGFFDWIGLKHEERREKHLNSTRDILLPYQKIENYAVNHFTNRFFGENKLELALGFQHNVSSEHCPLSDRTGNRQEELAHYRELDDLELLLKLNTFSANALYSYRERDRHTFDFVVNTQYEQNTIDGYNHIIPNYIRHSAGIALMHRYDISERWVLSRGYRLDYHHFDMAETLNPDPQYGDSIFNQEFSKDYWGTAFSGGLSYLPSDRWTFKINVGKSYRVPSAYELGAHGLHRHEGRFEKGDLKLKPEQAYQMDFGAEYNHPSFSVALSPFFNYFANYLFLNPTPYLRSEGQVYEYQQTTALLYGSEVSLLYHFLDNFDLTVAGAYVYAVNTEIMSPLPFIPPLSVLADLSYNFNNYSGSRLKNPKIGLESVHTAAQNYTAPNELKTPAYTLLHASLSADLKILDQNAHIIFRVRNITDAHYYNHVSFYRRMRIPEAGRDYQIFLKWNF